LKGGNKVAGVIVGDEWRLWLLVKEWWHWSEEQMFGPLLSHFCV
jgi:hypothetical protein